MSSTEEDNLLENFTDWLMNIDGAKRPARQAQNHKRIVTSIVRHNNDEEIKYQNLASPSFLNFWMTKLTEEKKEAATIKTYLCSVKHFLDLAVASGNNILGNTNLDKVRVLLQQWHNTLYREIQEDSHEKQVKDREFSPKPEEIKDFDNSQIVIMATRTLENSLTVYGFKINKQNFCLVRDYLLTSFILDNASRPGAISNMTLHEFSRAKRQNHGYVVSVKRHKTGYKGPANIACSKKVFTQLTNYLNDFRNKLEGISLAPNEKVFVSWNGGAMTSSLITMQMGPFWRRAVENQEATINPTLVRKYTTTVVHENMPELKQFTANLLCHSLGMAEKIMLCLIKSMLCAAAATSVKLRKVHKEVVLTRKTVLTQTFHCRRSLKMPLEKVTSKLQM